MGNFDKSTPFMLLARIHVKPGCVDQYLELARITDDRFYIVIESRDPSFADAKTLAFLQSLSPESVESLES